MEELAIYVPRRTEHLAGLYGCCCYAIPVRLLASVLRLDFCRNTRRILYDYNMHEQLPPLPPLVLVTSSLPRACFSASNIICPGKRGELFGSGRKIKSDFMARSRGSDDDRRDQSVSLLLRLGWA